jgi:hypothetical protein
MNITNIRQFIKKHLRYPTSIEVLTGVVAGYCIWSAYQTAKQKAAIAKAKAAADRRRRDDEEIEKRKQDELKKAQVAQKKGAEERLYKERLQTEKKAKEEKENVEKLLKVEQAKNLHLAQEAEKAAQLLQHSLDKKAQKQELREAEFVRESIDSLSEFGALPFRDSEQIFRATWVATEELQNYELKQRKVIGNLAKVVVRRHATSWIHPTRLVDLATSCFINRGTNKGDKAFKRFKQVAGQHNVAIRHFQKLVLLWLVRNKASKLQGNAFKHLSTLIEDIQLKENALEVTEKKKNKEETERKKMEKLNAQSSGTIKPASPSKRPFLKADPQPVADNKVKSSGPFKPWIKSNIPYMLDAGVKDSFATVEQLEAAFPEYYNSERKSFLGLANSNPRIPQENNYPRYLAVHDGMVMPTSFAVRKVFDSASQIRGAPVNGQALSIQLLHPLWMAHPRVKALQSYSPGTEVVNGRKFHWVRFPFVKEDFAWEFNLMLKAPLGYLGRTTFRDGEHYVPYVQSSEDIPSEFWVVPCRAFYTWNGGLLFFLAGNFLRPKGMQMRDKLNLSLSASLNLAPKGLEPKALTMAGPSRIPLPPQDSSNLDRKIAGSKMQKAISKRLHTPVQLARQSLLDIMAEQVETGVTEVIEPQVVPEAGSVFSF